VGVLNSLSDELIKLNNLIEKKGDVIAALEKKSLQKKEAREGDRKAR